MGWSESISLISRILTRCPTLNRQSIAVLSTPAVRSRNLQCMVACGARPVDLDHVVFPLDPVGACYGLA